MTGYLKYLLAHSASSANILAVTSVCNVACIFCSHRHNPAAVKTYRIPPLSREEVRELAGFLDPERRIVIGESISRLEEGEPFSHPEFLAILQDLRWRMPDTPIQVTTNGSLLTRETVRKLADLGRIEINLSLNSATLCGRLKLMQDRQAPVALESPELLYQYGIPYHGSLVAMPHIAGWEDVFATCHYLDDNRADTIRLFIPGYTRYAPDSCRYPRDLIGELRQQGQRTAAELQTPLTIEPFVPEDTQPEVAGVIAGSPAAVSGIQRGDVIRTVNGQSVRSRVETFQAVSQATSPVSIELERSGQRFSAVISQSQHQRPGLVMYHDIDYSLVDRILSTIRSKQAGRTLLLTSESAHPLWQKVWQDEPGVITAGVPAEFFGGVIQAAGLLTVSDYQAVLDAKLADVNPQLICIPQISFDAAGKDLTGQSYLETDTKGTEIVLL
ncbi:radical SAM protein [Acetonema longum]|uniref:Uncharacterized protein n=1 Tax=Acetonema longum DSM 6540 TaxID=1009370 RepID=F7NI47_9FIRM|nr:radical SAM protein [Acetonema longum]EGO64279.1 hypothetical protein ALO_08725 [Acetonema longum DSM 6540]